MTGAGDPVISDKPINPNPLTPPPALRLLPLTSVPVHPLTYNIHLPVDFVPVPDSPAPPSTLSSFDSASVLGNQLPTSTDLEPTNIVLVGQPVPDDSEPVDGHSNLFEDPNSALRVRDPLIRPSNPQPS